MCIHFFNLAITQYWKKYRFPSDNSAKLVIFKSIFFDEILILSKKENYFDVNKIFLFRYFYICEVYNKETNEKQLFKTSNHR